MLLGGDSQEQHRPARWLTHGEGARQLDQSGSTGGVVGGAVVDLVAGQALVLAEVVPVRHVDDDFVRGAGAQQPRDDVLRVDRPQAVAHPCEPGHTELHRLKIAARRLGLLGLEIEPGHLEQRRGGIPLYPTLDRRPSHVAVVGDQVERLAVGAAPHDLPGIAGGTGLVNHE